jgi:hypothetical protein
VDQLGKAHTGVTARSECASEAIVAHVMAVGEGKRQVDTAAE